MDTTDILEELRTLSREVMKKEGVIHYVLNVEGQTAKGENYASKLIFFNAVSKKTGDQYDFVMKTANRSEHVRKTLGDGSLYEREMFMYSEVFPLFHTFSKEVYPSFEFDMLPKMYVASQEKERETLILENLKSKGYRLWDRTKPMNFEHIKLVLENYGKFHALSMALNQQKPEHFRKLVENVKRRTLSDVSDVVKILERDFNYALRLIAKCGRNHLVEKMTHILKNLGIYILEGSKTENRIVITHGDCWNNNFMFRYKDDTTSKPTKMCLIDFQLSTLESPVVDLSYYIYSSCDDVALQQFDSLLKIYHDSLSATLSDLGSDPEVLFTFEQLKVHWKVCAVFGLIMAPSLLKMQLCASTDAPEMNDIGKEGKDMSSVFDYKLENEEIYTKRILDVFTHYANTCL